MRLNRGFISRILLFLNGTIVFRRISRQVKKMEDSILKDGNPHKIRVMDFVNENGFVRQFSSNFGSESIFVLYRDNKIAGLKLIEKINGKKVIKWHSTIDKFGIARVDNALNMSPGSYRYAEHFLSLFSIPINPIVCIKNNA